MIKINLQETFQQFKVKLLNFFKNSDTAAELDSYSDENSEIDGIFAESVDTMIDGACGKLKAYEEDRFNSLFYADAKDNKNYLITKVSNFLSFDTITKAQRYLPTTYGIENDYFYKALNLFFYATLLIDPKIEARFEVGYMLSRNRIEVGKAGYSEKLGKELPYYLTYLDGSKKLIVVDPIKGTAETITFHISLEYFKVVGQEFRIGETKWGVVKSDGSLEFLKPYDKGIRDYKAAERKVKRESGKKVKETTWQTVSLGSYCGSAKYMRVHSLIALMVYGLEVVKFGLMEANSILTIDHIDSKHDNNNIDNFALLTRQHNCSKGSKEVDSGFYIDYFSYLSGGSLV